MYPYDANRADELTIQPGDVISVLYIDNENWWMGELADGRQGYFPSNYVMEQGESCICCCHLATHRKYKEPIKTDPKRKTLSNVGKDVAFLFLEPVSWLETDDPLLSGGK